MYDIRQFRPTLYMLIAMGFTGFAVSVGAPIFWLLGMAMLVLNVWLNANFYILSTGTAQLICAILERGEAHAAR